jgi:hypothetical protein
MHRSFKQFGFAMLSYFLSVVGSLLALLFVAETHTAGN